MTTEEELEQIKQDLANARALISAYREEAKTRKASEIATRAASAARAEVSSMYDTPAQERAHEAHMRERKADKNHKDACAVLALALEKAGMRDG